jgi:septum formation protein
MAGPIERGIYLASRSPRRRELLAQIGVRYSLLLFRSRPESREEVNEDPLPGEAPAVYVERVARAKAETTVALEGRILGKPASRDEAAQMLASLSGTRHEVLTAVALQQGDWLESAVSVSEVAFKALTEEEIKQYVATGECDDKAGAYAIQGRAARFVVELRGSYSGVMGLPLYETSQLLDKLPQRR